MSMALVWLLGVCPAINITLIAMLVLACFILFAFVIELGVQDDTDIVVHCMKYTVWIIAGLLIVRSFIPDAELSAKLLEMAK